MNGEVSLVGRRDAVLLPQENSREITSPGMNSIMSVDLPVQKTDQYEQSSYHEGEIINIACSSKTSKAISQKGGKLKKKKQLTDIISNIKKRKIKKLKIKIPKRRPGKDSPDLDSEPEAFSYDGDAVLLDFLSEPQADNEASQTEGEEHQCSLTPGQRIRKLRYPTRVTEDSVPTETLPTTVTCAHACGLSAEPIDLTLQGTTKNNLSYCMNQPNLDKSSFERQFSILENHLSQFVNQLSSSEQQNAEPLPCAGTASCSTETPLSSSTCSTNPVPSAEMNKCTAGSEKLCVQTNITEGTATTNQDKSDNSTGFKLQSALKRIGFKPYICNVCDKRYSRKTNLEQHMAIHSTELGQFLCKVCNARYPSYASLANHLRMHKGDELYTCQMCGQRFENAGGLARHMMGHTGKGTFECKVCRKRFGNAGSLATHMKTHTDKKPFECPECPRRFLFASGLKKHSATHSGLRPFPCDLCDKRFMRMDALLNHSSTHTGNKPFACDVCDRRFAVQDNLTKHRFTHTGERPYTCGLCEKRFAHPSTLAKHTLTHTDEKPYGCSLCKRPFSRMSSLNRHAERHIKNIEDQPLCPVCQAPFLETCVRDRHMLVRLGKSVIADKINTQEWCI